MQTGIFTYRMYDAADAFFDEFDIKAVEICKSPKIFLLSNQQWCDSLYQ